MIDKAVAIIPARGGSKRIPGKNVRIFAGKPIISYSIESALKSGCFDRVMVSTDSSEIARIARQHGAEVPFLRADETAGDTTGMAEVVIEVLHRYRDEGTVFSHYCCLLATAPFVSPDMIQDGRTLMFEEQCESVATVCEFSYPIQRALRISAAGNLEMIWPENYQKRSQDLEKAYHDAALFYWGKTAFVERTHKLFDDSSRPIAVSINQCQDIDTEEDWRLAELKFKLLKGE
ncbi:MAG: pseudaminic acid cytidylyltransferase [Candidatus Melainabacteria bacterium]|nr:pseudaminic acid cytidylyltransferase [Candidatus Melainabacteria bacterium]